MFGCVQKAFISRVAVLLRYVQYRVYHILRRGYQYVHMVAGMQYSNGWGEEETEHVSSGGVADVVGVLQRVGEGGGINLV